ncbi:MAG: endolytic transglycosylase MltG [Nitrospirae bacterium]|nr:endolytic transglycosylase MltG [Nitrospirota bacterium]
MKRAILFVIFIIVGFFFIYVLSAVFIPIRLDKPIEVRIKKGMSFKEAVDTLYSQGLIHDKNIFIALGKISRLDKRIKPGYYPFMGSMNAWNVFKALKMGFIIQSTLTILEGDSLLEIKKKLSLNEIITEEVFDRLSNDKTFLMSLNISAPSLEGYLFPDTYAFPKGLEPEEVLRIMVQRLRQKFSGDLITKAHSLRLSEREVLTLASIIEKEAQVNEERYIISAVYHNRLKRRMLLQADPTSIYGIKPQGAGIKIKDLKRKTPYNTYHIKGLPPGPIASPGINSIKATLYPSKVPYLYFVSNGDGTHTFSITLSDHLKAIELIKEMKKNSEGDIKNDI